MEEKNNFKVVDYHNNTQWVKNIDFCCGKMSIDYADNVFKIVFNAIQPFLDIADVGRRINLCPYCGEEIDIVIKKVK